MYVHRLEAELNSACDVDAPFDEALSKSIAGLESYRTRAERTFHKAMNLIVAPKEKG